MVQFLWKNRKVWLTILCRTIGVFWNCYSNYSIKYPNLFWYKDTLRFLSNFFHGQIAQKYIDHLKNVALEKLMNKPPSNPATFEQERPLRPGFEAVSTLHRPKNDILAFFKFLGLTKEGSRMEHLLISSRNWSLLT